MSHEEKEEFSLVDPHITKDFLVGHNHQHTFSRLPSSVNYIPKRLPRESPKFLRRSYSPILLSSFLVDLSHKTPSRVGTLRPLVHISYRN